MYHAAGEPYLTPVFTIYPPSPQELKEYFKEDPNIKLDFDDPLITNQIKSWKPLKWNVPITCQPPLSAENHLTGKRGIFIDLLFNLNI